MDKSNRINVSGFLLLLILIFQPSTVFSQYKLQQISGFKIDSFLPVEIIDYHPQSKLYLGYINNPKNTEIVLINEEGEIIIQKVLVGEGPNQSSSTLNSMAFTDIGDIWIQTTFQILLYDQKLNLKKRDKYFAGSTMYLYGYMRIFPYFFRNDTQSGFSFITNPSGITQSTSGKDFSEKKLLEIFELDQERLYEMAPISERSLFKNLHHSIYALYKPVFTIDKNNKLIYLTAALDNEITVYNLITQRLESRIKIEHGEFKALKNASISDKTLPSYNNIITLTAKNDNIFLLDGGIIVLDYIREIPYGTYEKKKADDPTYHHFTDPSYHRLIIFDSIKQLTGDLPMPFNGKLMMGLPGNRLLVQMINPEVEEDSIRYGVFKVVKNSYFGDIVQANSDEIAPLSKLNFNDDN